MIDQSLVRRLIASQFPQWSHLEIRPVAVSGWDNRTFHLGDDMLVRMPSAEKYAGQVEKEFVWLPKLAPFLPLQIPVPLALGEPGEEYPWRWGVYRWLAGETTAAEQVTDRCIIAESLARFILALHRIDPTNGPLPGLQNFWRGGALVTYDVETRRAITALHDKIDANVATAIWEKGLASQWAGSPVWVHGDLSPGNLLVQDGRLSAVIDFGQLAIGDPACDLVIAWTVFGGESYHAFRSTLQLDDETWDRARAWALWKGLIIVAGFTNTNAIEMACAWSTLRVVFADYEKSSSS